MQFVSGAAAKRRNDWRLKNTNDAVIYINMSNLMSTEQSKKPCGARHSGPFVVK